MFGTHIQTFIKASKYESLTLTHRLQSFLLSYHSTPQSMTNVAPCKLSLGRHGLKMEE